MACDRTDSAHARVRPFFDALLERDGGGGWLPPLLAATPHGRERLGELADAPGWLQAPVAVRTETGARGAFEYPAPPTRRLLAWMIDHPDELTWPEHDDATRETIRLRRALIEDDPPGVRARAQDRAHDLLRASVPLGRAWWRFEDAAMLDGVLMTDRLVIVVHGRRAEPAGAATPWLPRRTKLVRDLEAARRLADGAKAWATVVISDVPVADAREEAVAAAVEDGAPHLDDAERDALRASYLGNLTWADAARAAGVDLGALPGWTAAG